MAELTKLQQALAEKRAREAAEREAEEQKQLDWSDFVVQVEPQDLKNVPPEQVILDEFIEKIGIEQAYNQWAGKGIVKTGGRKESIKVRCPNPDHPDHNPSAWLNTEKDVFNCAKCGGGDLWDIAAWRFGFQVPGYKQDKESFRLLREKIGEHFGIIVSRGIAGDYFVTQVEPVSEPVTEQPAEPITEPAVSEATPSASVYRIDPNTGQLVFDEPKAAAAFDATGTQAVQPTPAPPQEISTEQNDSSDEESEEDTDGFQSDAITWHDLVPEGTFLRKYLESTCVDDSPEEFHFWQGLIALGLAVGGMRYLEDSPHVYGNLYVCLVGDSGQGKSKSKRHLINLIHEALPYDRTAQPTFGAQYLTGIQSGEILIKSYQHPLLDPITNKAVGMWPYVRGCIEFDELASLIGKSSRMGSTLKTTLMELYDSPRYLSSATMAHGSVIAEKPFGSVITTTQPKAIRELLTRNDDHSGFANRWVFVTGRPKQTHAINRVYVDLHDATKLLTEINLSARAPEQIGWNHDAEEVWTNFFHGTFQPKRLNSDQTIIQRMDLLFKKLFLLFAVNEKEKSVTASIVTRVLQLFPYLCKSYGMVETQIRATQESDETEYIISKIKKMTVKYGRGPTARELINFGAKGKFSSVAVLRKLLENLVVLGVLDENKLPAGPKGGRPSSVYTVNQGH